MRIMLGALALVLAGCATSEPPPVVAVADDPAVTGDPAMAVRYEPVVHPGDAVVSAVSAPFLIVFRGVVCAASVVVAAPTAALVSLSEPRLIGPTTASLGDGLAANCGPPYVLSPYRYVPVAAAVPPAGPVPHGGPVPPAPGDTAAPTPLM